MFRTTITGKRLYDVEQLRQFRICSGLAAVTTSEVNLGHLFKLTVFWLLPPSEYEFIRETRI